jgi:DNA-binding response OmpR family regulator
MTLLRELRRDRAHQNTPVIILTSSARDSDRIDARAAGAAAFLTKPASTHELRLTVSNALMLHGPMRQPERGMGKIAPRIPVRQDARPEWAASPA